MSTLMFVVVILLLYVVGRPLAHGWSVRLSRGELTGEEVRRLRGELLAIEQRLGDTESRLVASEERLDFYEKLLAAPRPPDRPG